MKKKEREREGRKEKDTDKGGKDEGTSRAATVVGIHVSVRAVGSRAAVVLGAIGDQVARRAAVLAVVGIRRVAHAGGDGHRDGRGDEAVGAAVVGVGGHGERGRAAEVQVGKPHGTRRRSDAACL